MTHSNNTTRARAHEAKAEKVRHAYMLYSNHQPPQPLTKESFAEMADRHDQTYHAATWSVPDTEPEEAMEAYRLLYGYSIRLAVVMSAIIFAAFGLGLGYLLFHP